MTSETTWAFRDDKKNKRKRREKGEKEKRENREGKVEKQKGMCCIHRDDQTRKQFDFQQRKMSKKEQGLS